MSKGSLFWANASGKLGETVLYRSGGEQRTRTYVAKIKNPKTLAQMENRLSMRNFAQVYRALQPILSKSFPNRAAKESGFNAFVKANKSINSAVVSKAGADAGLCVPYNMQVSKGYLTQFGEFKTHEVFGGSIPCFDLMNHPNIAKISEVWTANAGGQVMTEAVLKQVWDALQLPSNAVISVIYCSYEDEGYRIQYSQVTKDTPTAALNAMKYRLYLEGGNQLGEKAHPCLSVGEGYEPADMTCIIISWVDGNGKLQVTNSRIVPPSLDSEYATQFVKGGDVYQQVLDDYGYTQGSTL